MTCPDNLIFLPPRRTDALKLLRYDRTLSTNHVADGMTISYRVALRHLKLLEKDDIVCRPAGQRSGWVRTDKARQVALPA